MKKFAIVFPTDHTIMYLAEEPLVPYNGYCITTKYSEARLFNSKDEALAMMSIFLVMYDDDSWLEEIDNESEFRNRPNTW
jgi:hypothetical protein